SAMTATAPASSAIFACSGVVTSIMTPPLSDSAMLRFLSRLSCTPTNPLQIPPGRRPRPGPTKPPESQFPPGRLSQDRRYVTPAPPGRWGSTVFRLKYTDSPAYCQDGHGRMGPGAGPRGKVLQGPEDAARAGPSGMMEDDL